jgi:hypothetical protein
MDKQKVTEQMRNRYSVWRAGGVDSPRGKGGEGGGLVHGRMRR